MKWRSAAIVVFLLLAHSFGVAQEQWKMDESRPLGKFAARLVRQLGYLVTYEEAPYDERELRTDVYQNGTRYRSPAWKSMTFNVRPWSDGATVEPNAESKPEGPQAEEIVSRLVREYNASGNPGRFSVVVNGDYIHIIQTERSVNGKLEPFDPILKAKIIMSTETRLCDDVMREFLFQLAVVRGAHVVQGMVSANALLRCYCTISGTDLTAREVLLQMLRQMGDNGTGNQPTRFAYSLMHDANGDIYFLSTVPAPLKMIQSPAGPAATLEGSEQRTQQPIKSTIVKPKQK
jgi:hypothetical protein